MKQIAVLTMIFLFLLSCTEKDKTPEKAQNTKMPPAQENTSPSHEILKLDNDSINLDLIVKRHLSAIGQEKLSKITTLSFTGKFVQAGVEVPYTLIQKRDRKSWFEITTQTRKIIQGYNGSVGWALVQSPEGNKARKVAGPDLEKLEEQAEMDSYLYNWKQKAYSLTLEGLTKIDTAYAYLLRLTKKNGNVVDYFIDKNSYLLIKTSSNVKTPQYSGTTEKFYTDYKPVSGILFPFLTEFKLNGQLMSTFKVEKIEINRPFDNKLFEMP